MKKTIILFTTACALSAVFIASIFSANAANLDKDVEAFKRILADNPPGANFQKRRYLALDKVGEKVKRYEGALSNMIVRLQVTKQGVIKVLQVTSKTDDYICRHIRPAIENKYGEFKKKSSPSVSGNMIKLKENPIFGGVKLKHFYSVSYKYKTNGISASLDCHEVVMKKSGGIEQKPGMSFWAEIE